MAREQYVPGVPVRPLMTNARSAKPLPLTKPPVNTDPPVMNPSANDVAKPMPYSAPAPSPYGGMTATKPMPNSAPAPSPVGGLTATADPMNAGRRPRTDFGGIPVGGDPPMRQRNLQPYNPRRLRWRNPGNM